MLSAELLSKSIVIFHQQNDVELKIEMLPFKKMLLNFTSVMFHHFSPRLDELITMWNAA